MTFLMIVFMALACMFLFLGIVYSIRGQAKKDVDIWKKGGYFTLGSFIVLVVAAISVFIYICI